jgi:hypothetical protein
MKQFNSNQEILLNSSSSFFKKEYAVKAQSKDPKKLNQKEQIADMVWNGLLPELLPEITENDAENKPLHIWEINTTQTLVDIRLGEKDENLNDEFSINPYVMLTLKDYN